MKNRHSVATTLFVTALALGASHSAWAQSTSTASTGSPMYSAGNSYVGGSIGRSDFSLGNGTGAFASDKRDTSYSLAVGSYMSGNFGAELGYTDFGKLQRGGGTTRAEGINLSAVGRMPLSSNFNLLGKIGATYGHTRVSAAAGSGITSGSESGLGVSLGLGAEYVFTPQLSAVLQYELHDLKFAGGGRDHIGNTSLGLRYRF